MQTQGVYTLTKEHTQWFLGSNEVPGYEYAMGKKKGVDFIFMGYITAGVKIKVLYIK